MGKPKSSKQQTVGKVNKNHSTGREEVRKDKLYSFVVPTFQGWDQKGSSSEQHADGRK